MSGADVGYSVKVWVTDDDSVYIDSKRVEGWSPLRRWQADREYEFRPPKIEIRKIPERHYSIVLKLSPISMGNFGETFATTQAEKEIIEHHAEEIILKEPTRYYWVKREYFDTKGGNFLLGWRKHGYKHVIDWEMFHKSLDESIAKLGITKEDIYALVLDRVPNIVAPPPPAQPRQADGEAKQTNVTEE